MVSPRDARIGVVLVLLLASGVVWNVAFLQNAPRERNRPVIPVGVHVPMSAGEPTAERRPRQGPVTLSLADLIEQSAAQGSSEPMVAPQTSGPIDRGPPAASPSAAPPAALVRDVQAALATRGYAPGAADGQAGPMTRAAILAFEHDHGLPATAEVSERLLAALRSSVRPVFTGADWRTPSEAAAHLVRTVQQRLLAAGYLQGTPSGVFDTATVNAIRTFEAAHQLVPTGRISAPLMARLQQSGRARLAAGQ